MEFGRSVGFITDVPFAISERVSAQILPSQKPLTKNNSSYQQRPRFEKLTFLDIPSFLSRAPPAVAALGCYRACQWASELRAGEKSLLFYENLSETRQEGGGSCLI